jgi:hypothetical protein
MKGLFSLALLVAGVYVVYLLLMWLQDKFLSFRGGFFKRRK